jgi:type I restriction enzyme S subunit
VLKAACEGRLVPTEAELARKENRSLPAPRPGMFYVYAIRCDNESLYIGQTDDLHRRWHEHVTAQACDWTRQHRPLYVAHYEEHSSREAAVEREQWLKTGFGRKWLKREIAAGRARQAGYETGEQLLQRTLKERREKWNGKGKYKEPTKLGIADLPTLPEGWSWTALDTLLVSLRIGWSSKPDAVSGIPILRISAVRPMSVNLEDVRYLSGSVEQYADYLIEPGDLLFTRYNGNPALTGVCGVVPAIAGQAVYPDKLIRVQVASDLCKPTFVCLAANVGSSREFLARRARTTAGQTGISGADLRQMPVPLAPLAEQRRIVTEIERRLSTIDELLLLVAHSTKRASRLRQAILQQAFCEA